MDGLLMNGIAANGVDQQLATDPGLYQQLMTWLDLVIAQITVLYQTFSVQLSDRLLPLIEQLRPVWSDPLWQALALILGLVAALFLGAWLLRNLSAVAVFIYELLKKMLTTLGRWLAAPFKWLWAKLKQTKQQRPKKSRWQGLNMLQVRRAVNGIKYLTTKRDWRYATPWMLLIGEQGSGKSEFISSVQAGRRAQLLPQEKNLRIPGSGWHFFDYALVIEQDNTPPKDQAEPLSRAQVNERFAFLLQQLHWYRPERPLDAIVMTVSAKSLLQAKAPAALHALGEDLYQQLWQCQKQSGFVLPVYLIVTQCDQVEGFNAYWQAQPVARLKEIIGWSSPYRLDTAYNSQWVAEAFVQINNSLQEAQLQVAASGKAIDDIDRFMLFRQYFSQLQQPLETVANGAFARSSFQEAPPLRGIYFCGQLNNSVAFVDDLMAQKVFAEKHLAYPLEKRRFSTQKTLRRAQIASVIAAVTLVLLLSVDSYRLNGYTQYTEDNLQRLMRLNQDCTSEGLDTYRMLDGLTKISDRPLLLSMPGSWLGTQAQREQQMVADELFKKTLFQSLECRLKLRADALRAYTEEDTKDLNYRKVIVQLKAFGLAMEQFQINRERFLALAGPLPDTDGVGKKFQALLKYLYDRPIPDGIDPGADITAGAIQKLDFAVNWDEEGKGLIARDVLLQYFDELSTQLQLAILEHAKKLPLGSLRDLSERTLVYSPDQPLPPSELLTDIDKFQAWLIETEQDWLGESADSSPCGKVYQLLNNVSKTLLQSGYNQATLSQIVERFSPSQCDHKVRVALAKLNVAPFGDMFVRDKNEKLAISPSLNHITDQVADLETLDFVKNSYPALTSSTEPVVAWRETQLQQTINVLLNYQQFLVAHSDEKQSFFINVLKNRLQLVVERLLSSAMIRPSQLPPSPFMVDDPASFNEAQLSQSVASFKLSNSLILQTNALLQQMGDDTNHIRLTQASNRFVNDQLLSLDTLTRENRLYQPVKTPQWDGKDFARSLFSLDTDKQIDNYVSSQRERLSFLSYKYAAPLITYLQNAEHGVSGQLAQKWWNTLSDLGKYQRGEPQNAIVALDDYISVNLAAMDDINCLAQLSAAPAASDNSWYSIRLSQLQKEAGVHCQDAGQNKVEKRYLALRSRFNREIAGRFPFADVNQAGYTEMSVASLHAYLSDYRLAAQDLLTEITAINSAKPGTIPSAWIDFIQRMNTADQLFAALWSDKDSSYKAKVNVAFAVQPEYANGANQIIEWTLDSGKQQLIYPNGEEQGGYQFDWQLGLPLALKLRWALGSSFEPLEQPGQKDNAPLQVDRKQLTAQFQSQGNWGLFEWLARYADYDDNNLTAAQTEQRLLSFYVPVMLKDASVAPKAQSYVSRSNIRIWITVTGEKGEPITLPLPGPLPSYAPGFND